MAGSAKSAATMPWAPRCPTRQRCLRPSAPHWFRMSIPLVSMNRSAERSRTTCGGESAVKTLSITLWANGAVARSSSPSKASTMLDPWAATVTMRSPSGAASIGPSSSDEMQMLGCALNRPGDPTRGRAGLHPFRRWRSGAGMDLPELEPELRDGIVGHHEAVHGEGLVEARQAVRRCGDAGHAADRAEHDTRSAPAADHESLAGARHGAAQQ